MLEHAQELISKLDSQGIQPSQEDDVEDGDDNGDEWEDVDSAAEDGDVEMS